MTPIISHILATIFAFIIFELPGSLNESFQLVKGNEITRAPMFSIDPINSAGDKNSNNKLNPIAQPFVPLVVIAPTLFEVRDYEHYLPLFAQYRPKDYFLLI